MGWSLKVALQLLDANHLKGFAQRLDPCIERLDFCATNSQGL
jgi:hypothetical protein